MINVFHLNPRGVSHYFEELILKSNDKTLLAKNNNLLIFLETNLKEVNTLNKEKIKYTIKILKDSLNGFNNIDILRMFEFNII